MANTALIQPSVAMPTGTNGAHPKESTANNNSQLLERNVHFNGQNFASHNNLGTEGLVSGQTQLKGVGTDDAHTNSGDGGVVSTLN